MMNIRNLLILTVVSLTTSCSSFCDGAMPRESVNEFLGAERMAVTRALPGWALADKDIRPLEQSTVAQLKSMISPCPLRHVPERYYRSPEAGNRGDVSEKVFYLYADNAQCLGARVLPGKRVTLDDFTMSEATERQLYTLLESQLIQLYPGLKKNGAEK